MTAVPCSADRAAGALAVKIARRWVGTPYRHQASAEGAGADCLGLLRGIWRELYGAEPEPVPAYGPTWAEASGEERLIAAASRHMREVMRADAMPGDVCLFRLRAGAVAKHVAVLTEAPLARGRIVHAYSGHAVCETWLGAGWQRRLVGLYRLPPFDGGLT